MSDDVPLATPNPAERRGPWRWLRWVLLGCGVVVVAAIGLLLWYVYARDSPDPLDEGDLAERLATTTTLVAAGPPLTAAGGSVPAGNPASTQVATAPAGGTAAPAAGGSAWTVTDASVVGYRIKEVLFGLEADAVGRTNQVTGSLTFDGTVVTAAEFEVDVATIESDDSRRDNQFRGRIMSVDEFPTATFVLTEPIDVGIEPVEGATATATATGELTLRGVTNPVTFEVQAQVLNGQIGVLGNIPVVFADYGIANPSTAGVTTEDNGLLEFVLVFVPA
jgi:polyisoprenoid-binding protein YceI